MLIENYRKLQRLCIEFEVLTAVVMNDVLEEDGVVYIPPKRWFTYRLHDTVSQKMATFIYNTFVSNHFFSIT
jgi:hypothetical protein